ncbi:MAG: MBL fold metallo-hydrolase [Myxococcota bacterium]
MSDRFASPPIAIVAIVVGVLGSGCFFPRVIVWNTGELVSPTDPAPTTPSETRVEGAELVATWVGHATTLIQIHDKFILTDPVFTHAVGQVSPRLVEPGIVPERLPPIDAVIISHLHFDHLSVGTLELIEDQVRMALVPSQGLAYLPNLDFPAQDLRTWDRWEAEGLRITSVPVDHAGGRLGLDAAFSYRGFTGYIIEYRDLTVFFGGDSAYDRERNLAIARRFPDIDLALIPIAPITPRSMMKPNHMNPEEALQAFEDLEADQMVPIHFDTFINSYDDPGDALRLLREGMADRELTEEQVAILRHGEQRRFR